jgi:hypothetical protein
MQPPSASAQGPPAEPPELLSKMQFVLGVLSAVISSYGINLITTSSVEPGGVLVAIAVVLESISFFMTYKTRKKKG